MAAAETSAGRGFPPRRQAAGGLGSHPGRLVDRSVRDEESNSTCACRARPSMPAVGEGGQGPSPTVQGRAREGRACACRGIILLLFLASPSTMCSPSHTTRQRARAPAPVVGVPANDCSGDEEFARRLQEEEVRAAVAATAVRQSGGRVNLPDGRHSSGQALQAGWRGEALLRMAHMASTRLADEDSRALCYELGDRGFEGTGLSVDVTNSTGVDDRVCADRNRSASEFLLGSVGRVILPVLREGVNRIFELPRTLVTIAELGAKCVPIPGIDDRQVGLDEHQVDGGDGMQAANSGAIPAVDCASDEALARAIQEQEWLEARR